MFRGVFWVMLDMVFVVVSIVFVVGGAIGFNCSVERVCVYGS